MEHSFAPRRIRGGDFSGALTHPLGLGWVPMNRIAAYLSLALGLILFALYSFRPDWATAATILPAWIWLPLWSLSLPEARKGIFLTGSATWLLFGAVHIEEWKSFVRAALPVPEIDSSLTVSTINASGSIPALQDALSENPDILLVQESPPQTRMDELLSHHPEYDLLYGFDCSIIARGQFANPTNGRFYTSGTAIVDSREYFVVSLRLLTSAPRVDLWNPECWKSQSRIRHRQMKQIREVVALLPDDAILIVGGDFNVPQGDKVFSILDDHAIDTFATGGRGVCNTFLADIPVLRIDQIWTSPSLHCEHATARKCKNTDHRLYSAKVISPGIRDERG